MKTKTTYICEYCGGSYDSSTECAICEGSHANMIGIKRASYKKGFKYPERIWIKFADGFESKCVEYTVSEKK